MDEVRDLSREIVALRAVIERLARKVERRERSEGEPPPAGKALLTVREAVAAGYLPSERTAARWRAQGIGPPWRKHGRAVLYALEDLEAWSRRRTVLTMDSLRTRAEARRAP